MKHKVGDKVRIKSLDWYNENAKGDGSINCGFANFVSLMKEYCGKTATITKSLNYSYELDIGGCSWGWTDEMFDETFNMERRIGEKFEHEGVKLQCVENESCDGCFFYNNGSCLFEDHREYNYACLCMGRKDGKSVIFKKYNNMEQKEFTISIPDGYELDKEMSTFENIVLKKKENDVKTWNDLVGKQIPDGSKWIDVSGGMMKIDGKFGAFDKNVYIDKKHAKSALAMAQISQLMPYYGGAITDEEWNNSDVLKYSICRNEDYVSFKSQHYELLSFHTEEQRNDFLKYNEQLVKDYLMIE